jgi:hypothetical protein
VLRIVSTTITDCKDAGRQDVGSKRRAAGPVA